MKILLATDGQPHTDNSAEYAVVLASRYRAALFALYVMGDTQKQDVAFMEGKGVLQAIKMRALSKEVGITTMLETGEPAETIIEIADRIGADLVVLGASGKCGDGRRRPLGGVSGRVAQDACCSVMIVR